MLPKILLLFCSIFVTVIFTSPQKSPSTREKGEIACFSCFAKNSGKVSLHSKLPSTQTMENLTEIIEILRKGGMNIPILVNRCEDTIPILNPNFFGANIHICPNSDEHPGACVKFKGHYRGDAFVYRECWNEMWQDPRPFRHQMSGSCFSDDFVQSLLIRKKIQFVFVKMICAILPVP
jgi:hypothetical protein